MRLKAMLVLLAAVCAADRPAIADQVQSVRSLPPAKQYHHPWEIQILDERPTVVDMRGREEAAPLYRIDVPPLAGAPRPIVNIELPGEDGGSGGRGFTIDPTRPPRSGFGPSNIPARSVAPQNLPDGKSTNRLLEVAGYMSAPRPGQLVAHKPSAMPGNAKAPLPALGPAQTYAPVDTTTSGGDQWGRKTQVSVSGKLDRGSLLKER